ncbi:Neprolysin cd1, peptidase family m13, neutral zinc metallopeptidase, partial [Globisporangium splendens]
MKLFISAAIATAALGANQASAAFPSTVATLLDTTADPCEDFYQYTCGSWVKNTIIPASDTSVDYSFSTIGDRNELVVQEIVKEDWPLVGEFWDSCMNMDKLNELGSKPLQKTITKISGAATKEALFKVAGDIAKTGPSLFTGFGVYADDKDATTNVFNIGTSDLTLPSASYYLDNAFPQYEAAYRTYIAKVLELAGYNPNASQQQQQQGGKKTPAPSSSVADTVISIEQKVVEILYNLADSDDPDFYYNPIKYSEAAAKYPLSFGAFASGLGLLENSKLTGSSNVIFQTLEYFEKLEELLAKLELKDLKTYLTFLYTSHNARYLSDSFYQAYFDFFSKTIYGAQVRSERSSICVTRETTYFPDLIGKYYFMKMFDTQREESTKLMVKLVEEAMDEHIEKLSWLDAATKAEAEKKLALVSNLIGHSLQKKTYPFYLDREAFFDNIQKISLDNFENSLKNIGNPVDRTEWSMGASEVNAYYSPSKNQMVFPAGILQPPMFNGSSHPAQNFGSIGAIVGHELTHGFDSNGRLYDGYGNQKSWWTSETSAEFDTRAQCLKDEYSSFVVNGEDGSPLANVNGNLTITENIADNGGLSLAYDAYQKYIKSPEAVVPTGTEITEAEANQLFFIAFGQTFCGKARDGAMKSQLLTDVHSPGQWRINGATMNNENFAKAFQCKAGSKMNPEKKCVIW